MFEIPGYITLGEIDFSAEQTDTDATTLVLWGARHGGLYLLEATGCHCCGDVYDMLKAEFVAPVPSFEELAADLYRQALELPDSDDALQAEEDVRAALQAAAARLPWMNGNPKNLPELPA